MSHKSILVYSSLALLTFLAYANSLPNAFISDDIDAVLNNPAIHTFSGMFASFKGFQYYIVYSVFGPSPWAFRLVNIFFHIGNVLLIYSFAKRYKYHESVAYIGAALFALHPILSEGIVWISGGPYVQGTFYILATFLLYTHPKRTKIHLIASYFFYLLGLAISHLAFFLPLILLLHHLIKKDFVKNKNNILAIGLFFIVDIVMLAPQFIALGARIPTTTIQTAQSGQQLSNPLLKMIYAISSYIELMILPHRLALYHRVIFDFNVEFIIRAFVTALFFIGTGLAYFKNKTIFFWLAFFFIFLIPTFSPITVSWVYAERYLYLSFGGIVMIVGYILNRYHHLKTKPYIIGLSVVIGMILFGLTIWRNTEWYNEKTFAQSLLKHAPNEPKTYLATGNVYLNEGDNPNALKAFLRAQELQYDHWSLYQNLAVVYFKMNDYDKALMYTSKAIEKRGDSLDLYLNLAIMSEKANKPDQALKAYETILNKFPSRFETFNDVANIYFQLNQKQKAIEILTQGTKQFTDRPILFINLGYLYQLIGDSAKAELNYTKALSLDPSTAATIEDLKKSPRK